MAQVSMQGLRDAMGDGPDGRWWGGLLWALIFICGMGVAHNVGWQRGEASAVGARAPAEKPQFVLVAGKRWSRDAWEDVIKVATQFVRTICERTNAPAGGDDRDVLRNLDITDEIVGTSGNGNPLVKRDGVVRELFVDKKGDER